MQKEMKKKKTRSQPTGNVGKKIPDPQNWNKENLMVADFSVKIWKIYKKFKKDWKI
jgi:hypothetical protein